MLNKKTACILLGLITLFTFFSCSYKESFHNKIFVDYCKYTDQDLEVQLVWPNKKTNKTLTPEKKIKSETYKFWFKDPPYSGQVILLQKGKPIETCTITFPSGGLYSFCAYGGLYTRINIVEDKNGSPHIKITHDLETY